mgnify:CR=1 FL=1
MSNDASTTSRGQVGLFALATSQSIGRYTITAVLGQGGFGITYRARDGQLNRDVAIKEYLPASLAVRQDGITVLPRSTEAAEDFIWGRDRFVAEGSTLASLTEAPAIVRVYDFLELNGTAYIVMELVPGETLEARLRKQRSLPPQEIDSILKPMLDGLEQVHEAGFLHRDIKPANILLTGETDIKISDFGAALMASGEQTQVAGIGSPAYMSPQQIKEHPLNHQTDIYSLGVVMYQLLTGTLPFQATNNFSMMYQITNVEPVLPSSLRKDIPLSVDKIVRRAMQKDLERRYPGWEEFSYDLAEAFRDYASRDRRFGSR